MIATLWVLGWFAAGIIPAALAVYYLVEEDITVQMLNFVPLIMMVGPIIIIAIIIVWIGNWIDENKDKVLIKRKIDIDK